MAKILLIETATADCSIALLDGEKLVAFEAAEEPMSHTTQLTQLIINGLANAGWSMTDLNAIALSEGPGSYTALRVGAATAKGICYGQSIPLIAIDTLQALSQAIIQKAGGLFTASSVSFPMIDARRLEVYGAFYDHDKKGKQKAAAIILTKEFLESKIPNGEKLFIGGSGAPKAKVLVDNEDVILVDVGCEASNLAGLASQLYDSESFVDLAYFKPMYLKPPNITVPKPIWK